jgi:lipopolysaccharide transport system ATP-binding protein
MPSPIRLESVSKCYRIYQKPQDRFKQAFLNRWRTVLGGHESHDRSTYYREHWALRDISFEVRPGEAVGILGRNGAGKSTLLQIIAGTLRPTGGQVGTHGRITALLELGSGFNPEFTGKENVFLNASILGLSQGETEAKYEEIAVFADIGDFIDQPVKTYSSGMMMRLAFAVQTALVPTVLIVDEALAVGDIFFQTKCMRRLRDMREQGTTILLVSHSTGTIKETCTRAILLDHGRLIADGSPNDVSHRYLQLVVESQESSASSIPADIPIETEEKPALAKTDDLRSYMQGRELFLRYGEHERLGNRKAEFLNVALLDSTGNLTQSYAYGEPAICRMVIVIHEDVSNLWVGYKIRTKSGIDIIHADTSLNNQLSYPFLKGKSYVLEWQFKVQLVHGSYVVGCAIGLPDPPVGLERTMEYVDVINVAQTFSVSPRREGMIGATVVWDNELDIIELPTQADTN